MNRGLPLGQRQRRAVRKPHVDVEPVLDILGEELGLQARRGGGALHAVALRALLAEAPSVLSPAERQRLSDWLDRLATARNLRASMPPRPKASRRTHSARRLR